jgi:hypothetical protein
MKGFGKLKKIISREINYCKPMHICGYINFSVLLLYFLEIEGIEGSRSPVS